MYLILCINRAGRPAQRTLSVSAHAVRTRHVSPAGTQTHGAGGGVGLWLCDVRAAPVSEVQHDPGIKHEAETQTRAGRCAKRQRARS